MAREAIELDPSPTKPAISLARVLFDRGKTRRDEDAARKAAELQPTAAGNHRWQVFVAIQRGDGEAALREAKLEPNEGYRRFELALAYYARGDRRAANEALGRVDRQGQRFFGLSDR